MHVRILFALIASLGFGLGGGVAVRPAASEGDCNCANRAYAEPGGTWLVFPISQPTPGVCNPQPACDPVPDGGCKVSYTVTYVPPGGSCANPSLDVEEPSGGVTIPGFRTALTKTIPCGKEILIYASCGISIVGTFHIECKSCAPI
jgi:hypothetical protein